MSYENHEDWDEDPEIGYEVKEKVRIADTNLGESFLKSIGFSPTEKGKLFVEHCPFCKVEVMKQNKDCNRQYFHDQQLYQEKMQELNA